MADLARTISEGLKNQAINSYEKAAELYEKKGNVAQSQEIHNRIHEVENLPESASPTPSPPTPTPTAPSETPLAIHQPTSPEGLSTSISVSAVMIAVRTLIGISMVYYLISQNSQKKPKNN